MPQHNFVNNTDDIVMETLFNKLLVTFLVDE